MRSDERSTWLGRRFLCDSPALQRVAALLCIVLSACEVDVKDGVYACASQADCPSGLLCDPQWLRCTRHPVVTADPRAAMTPAVTTSTDSGSLALGGRSPSDAGRPDSANEQARQEAGAASTRVEPRAQSHDDPTDAGRDASPPAVITTTLPTTPEAANDGSAGSTDRSEPAGSGGADPGEAAGVAGGEAGAGGQGGAPSSSGPNEASVTCPQDAYCYGFEAGALDPSGALWPSPSDGRGGLPPNQELTTAAYPASTQNMMLVSRPSSKDGWPKATVGFSGPSTPFAELEVSFDYVADEALAAPNPRVILFRFVGRPAINGDSVNVGLLDRDVMLEVQTEGPDPLSAIGAANRPDELTHVVATFTRTQASCTVEIAYGTLPPKIAAFPCAVESWQIELGLDVLETPPERYNNELVAYFDNLQVRFDP